MFNKFLLNERYLVLITYNLYFEYKSLIQYTLYIIYDIRRYGMPLEQDDRHTALDEVII